MTQRPQLLGDRQILSSPFSQSDIIIERKDIVNYTRTFFQGALPRVEIGPLGQVSHRQLNSALPPMEFSWVLAVTDDKKSSLEGLIATQQRNYARNNERIQTDIVLNDQYLANLELAGTFRDGITVKPAGVSGSEWRYSIFTVKFTEFTRNRLNSELWTVQMRAVESQYDNVGA